jgi:hypothetical protein
MLLSKRSLAAVTALLSAVALAAPIADAGAATTTPGPYPGLALSGLFSLPGFNVVLPAFDFPVIAGVPVTKGPTVVDSVFNGATVVQVANGPTGSFVGASP